MKTLATPRRRAFTLVEILVVLAIIGILSAILFPAFGRARESARQTNCATNLQQIGLAVNQYYQDTKRYPDSLVDLLPDGAKYLRAGVEETIGEEPTGTKTRGTGYLKSSSDVLKCPNDDVDALHSSYGALEKSPSSLYVTPGPPGVLPPTAIPGNFVFNYWGYLNTGFALTSPAGVQALVTTGSNGQLLSNPATAASYDPTNPLANPMKYSLSNRYAPGTTIITHCVYHRPNTANDLALPTDLYATPAIGDGTGARDIVLRLDGTVKTIDVSAPAWNVGIAPQPPLWMAQK